MIVAERLDIEGLPTWDDICLHHASRPLTNLYALVDGALNEKLLARFRRRWPDMEWHSIYADFPEGQYPEFTPLLFPVRLQSAVGKSLYDSLSTAGQLAPESLLLIWSNAAPRDLSVHLGQYAQVETADDKRAIVRYHDPNIWPALLAVLESPQLEHFLAPMSEIWCPDLDNAWCKYSGGGNVVPPPLKEYRWCQRQQERFAELIQPRKILVTLEDEHGSLIVGSRAGWLSKIANWLKQAKCFGAVTAGAQYLYCVVALIAGDDFTADAVVAHELSAIGTRHANFEKAITAVPPDTWERLADDRQFSC